MRDDAEIIVNRHQQQQRADAGRRQRRKDRDRVDRALIEHAEDDVDDDQRCQRSVSACSTATTWNACALPWKLVGKRRPACRALCSTCWIAATASPIAMPGGRLNEMRHRRELALMVDHDRRHLDRRC